MGLIITCLFHLLHSFHRCTAISPFRQPIPRTLEIPARMHRVREREIAADCGGISGGNRCKIPCTHDVLADMV
jgi:hypothetical protein